MTRSWRRFFVAAAAFFVMAAAVPPTRDELQSAAARDRRAALADIEQRRRAAFEAFRASLPPLDVQVGPSRHSAPAAPRWGQTCNRNGDRWNF